MKGFIWFTLIALAITTCATFAAPEPAIVQPPGKWTVDATFTHPRQLIMRNGPGGQAQRYWYVILTVTNNTGRDVDFYPRCDMMTDTFQIRPAGWHVPAAVFGRVKELHLTAYPFLERLEKTTSKLLEGENNAKDLALIWPDFDPKANAIKIFVGGLSNEMAIVKHPVRQDEAGDPVLVFLRKTLELGYNIKGDPSLRSNMDLTHVSTRWIMR